MLKTPAPQLCVGSYRAEQLGDRVVIVAMGNHQTSGYQVFFQQSELTIWPPEFSLMHVFRASIVLKVETPFVEWTSFKATERIDKVMIHDGEGKKEIQIAHAPEALKKHAEEYFGKDGPFP